jgi:hypothetical protein
MSSLLKTKCVGGGIDLHRRNMISLSSLSTPSFNLFPDANGRENLCCVKSLAAILLELPNRRE